MIHHVGYVVEDLRAGVERFAAQLGIGPFLVMEHVPLAEATYAGEPAVYDHSTAFAAWGPILLELSQVHEACPAGLADAFVPPGGGVGHVAWLAADLDAEVARLRGHGWEPFHTGAGGPVRTVWLRGGPLGHPVEVHQDGPELRGFYARVREAADGWDGADPYRPQA